VTSLENQRAIATDVREKIDILTVQEVGALVGWKGDQVEADNTIWLSLGKA
jgi:hypothetical protein